jgi:hypothetical protein
MEKYHGKTVEYWKQNAEENYLTTPISVLKYITVLEEQAEQLRKHAVVGRSEQFYCTCSRAKGLDHDEEGTPYCISCQKEVQ